MSHFLSPAIFPASLLELMENFEKLELSLTASDCDSDYSSKFSL